MVNGDILGYPVRSLKEIPPGGYYVQALLNVYTEFHRADGHVIWAPDPWEGQEFNHSPGNLYSKPRAIHFDAHRNDTVRLSLTEVVPPVQVSADTEWVKHVKIQSKLLTAFWGRPIYLGAVVQLPRDYSAQPEVQYPVIYQATHFSSYPLFGFSTDNPRETAQARRFREYLGYESAQEFHQSWISDHFPRMITVNVQSPTPYGDTSLGVNSANSGPYGDAITTELIPYLEEHFRIIRKSYARVLTGGSAGGWASLALQVYHPDFFGGAWIFCPVWVDFRSYEGLANIYEDDNAFLASQPHGPEGLYQYLRLFPDDWSWSPPPERVNLHAPNGQPMVTMRQAALYEAVVGRGKGANAVWGPAGADGYPKPLWDDLTGRIDHSVANYMRDHGYDLRDYLEKNWGTIGPQLVGKLHFASGDMDETQVTISLYLLEDFLKSTSNPYFGGSFEYGRPMKGHEWRPTTTAVLVKMMADQIKKNAPAGSSGTWADE